MIYSLTVTNTIGESLTFELSNPWASGYAIKSINGLGTPDMNVNTTPYGIGDGSVLGSIKAEYRLITIVVWPLEHPTVETTRQKLYRFFQIKKDILLSFVTENRTVTIDGYVQNIEPNIFDNPESISIEIKCINPYFHKLVDDQTKFYGVAPNFEFPFSVEFEPVKNIGWTIRAFSINGEDYETILYENNKYLMIASNSNMAMISTDGFEWSPITIPIYCHGIMAASGNGIFLVTSDQDGTDFAYSQTGTRWVTSSVPTLSNGAWKHLSFCNDRFFLTAIESNQCAYSSNGVDWVFITLPESTSWSRMNYIYGNYIIMTNNSIYYSKDLMYWTQKDLPFTKNWNEIEYGNGIYVVVGPLSDKILYSNNFENWNSVDFEMFDKSMHLKFNDGKFYLLPGGLEKIYSSSDGINWTALDMPEGSEENIYRTYDMIINDNGKMVISCEASVLIYNPPGYESIDLIEFSNYTVDNRMEINYEGEIDTGIQITIECRTPPGDIIIYNVDTLEYIQIFSERIEAVSGAPLGPKDIIEINTESGNKYVRLLRNGIYYNILGAMNRNMTWFILKQGPNTFTYTTSDEHAAIVMTFSYQDTYAGI